ncbi:MAG: hypothetical protein ABIO39_15190 [Caulobacteraceae bacterium]
MAIQSQVKSNVVGWVLDPVQRGRLLRAFNPAYPDVIADHVTLAVGVDADAALPRETCGEIVGRIDDRSGLEVMVVSIGGSTQRPGGGVYHITWSLDRARGRTAVESNRVLTCWSWAPLPWPIPIALEPARWP